MHDNVISGKINFFHGINRPVDKGSKYIVEAMRIIEKKYPKYVKCTIVKRLPYNEYVNILSNANIIIDQCKGYGYGMNACISLAQGKIVMSGSEPDFIKAGNLYDCPIFNITPDVRQIVDQMEEIIENKNKFIEMGENGRNYIIKHHNYIEIAKQYVEEWRK